jgi:DNA-3-methyladenine glycosylase
MRYKRLPRSFFTRDTHSVAKGLLGKLLVRRWRNNDIVARICEVESYIGESDKACHAARGKTKRNAVMFGEAGHAYIYLIYGMYCCLNVVTERAGFPAAVLIRAAIPISKVGKAIDGPGKLTREMNITRSLNAENLVSGKKLYLADDGFIVRQNDIVSSSRIGVEYAGEDAKLPWRYYLRECEFVSRT